MTIEIYKDKPLVTIWYLQSHDQPPWAFADQIFTPMECKYIIETMSTLPIKVANTFDGKEHRVDHSLRKNKISWVPADQKEYEWIFKRCVDYVDRINKQFYNYDLTYIEALQFTIYDQLDDHYIAHTDFDGKGINYRKLSFSVQLSDPDSYQGSDLLISEGSIQLEKTKRDLGTMILFPSYLFHQVTPLKQGKRYSLVGWVCGPPFK